MIGEALNCHHTRSEKVAIFFQRCIASKVCMIEGGEAAISHRLFPVVATAACELRTRSASGDAEDVPERGRGNKNRAATGDPGLVDRTTTRDEADDPMEAGQTLSASAYAIKWIWQCRSEAMDGGELSDVPIRITLTEQTLAGSAGNQSRSRFYAPDVSERHGI